MKTIAIVGDRWWPQTTKQDGDRKSKQNICSIWTKRVERLNVGGVRIKSRNGVLRLHNDGWSMAKCLRLANNEYVTFTGGGFVHWGWRPLATAFKITSRTK